MGTAPSAPMFYPDQQFQQEEVPKEKEPFKFPEGGWYCNKCMNYNFKGRKACHRCKQPMTYKLQAEKQKQNCKFPPGGWECSKCCNYNFKGRTQCHRCKKQKDENDIDGMPEHLFEMKENVSENQKGSK